MKKSILSFSFFLLLFVLICGFSIAQPLAGAYTINSAAATAGTNFQTFNDFATSINTNGVSGAVVVTVTPGSGPYQGSVIFNNIPGASASSTVTLDGSGESISAVTTSNDRHVIRLTDCKFFTITNLHVSWDPASTGGFYGIHIFNTGNDITISNCDIDIGSTTSTLYGSIVASGSETSILTTGDFHRLNITGNTVSGGGYGVSVFGLLSNLASDIVIENNNIYDFHSNGIYLRETNGAVIRGNTFDKSSAIVSSINAIQIAQSANINTSIYNNYIHVSQTTNGSQTIRGIYLFNGTGHKVYNNVISDIRLTAGNFTAIEVRTGSTAPKIYFNTISIDNVDSTTGNLYGIKEELSNTNSDLKNNMISISQPCSGTKAGLVLGATATVGTAFSSDYNNIYVPGGNVAMKSGTTPVYYPTLATWSGASTQDANSFELDPQFSSVTDPVPTSASLNNKGTAIAGYTDDILGNLRSSTPDIGAYEFLDVGISSVKHNTSLLVYPNPVRNHLYFQSPDSRGEFSVEISDLSGRVVYTMNTLTVQNPRVSEIETRFLPAGTYLIRATQAGQIAVGRFVKLQ